MTKWSYCLFALFFGCAQIANAADTLSLPHIGDSSGRILSPAKEAELGAQIMRQFRYRLAIMDDPEIAEYIESLGYRLVAATNQAYPINFTFFVVNDERINAFAAPGGYIGVNAGLLLASETESELAGVMAHEIAHVTQRHIARSIELADRMSVPTIAALIGAVILGIANPPLGQASLMAILGGSTQYQLNFTRSNEYEADRIGILTLSKAGFDPMSMPAFFEKLQNSQRLAGIRIPEYLTTHPVTVDRIAESKGRAIQMPRNKMRLSDGFFIAKAKLEVLTSSSIDKAIDKFASRLKEGKYLHLHAAEYGYALGLLESNRLDEAAPYVEKLHNADPNAIPYITLKAKMLDKQGKFEEATDLYRHALSITPNNYALTLNFAALLLRNKAFENARTVLRAFLPYASSDPVIYKLLSRTSRDLNLLADAHRYMAEAYYLEGWTSAAIDQLKEGLKQGNLPSYMKQMLEARLKSLQGIFKEEIKNAQSN